MKPPHSPVAPVAPSRRILLVVNDLPFFLSHRLPLAIGARDAGYEVHIATPVHSESAVLEREGLSFHPFPLNRSRMGPWAELQSVGALIRIYRTVRPDLVHHVTIKPVIYGSWAARRAGIPAVVNAISGLGHVFAGNSRRAQLRRAVVLRVYRLMLQRPRTAVIFQNRDDIAVFEQASAVRHDQVVLIQGSGVDLEVFRPSPEAAGSPVIVFPARMLWTKGVGEFVAAGRVLHASGVACRLVLVGGIDPGNPDSVSAAQLAEWAAEGVVEVWGHQTDMASVLTKAHIVSLPSITREGVPKALLEAAACGRPVVTTDVPGCRETIVPGRTGLLVPPADVSALAEGLRWLVEHPAERLAFGEAARRLAEERFSVTEVVRQTLGLYERLLTGRSIAG
jgi:glycosyltransferase involved in cell wall biosynthesis